MLALLKNVFSTATSPRIIHHQELSSFGLIRLFSSSQTRSKFHRPQPTNAEMLTMDRKLRWYYKHRNDPITHQKSIERQRVLTAKLKQWRLNDPEFKQKELALWRKWTKKNKSEEHYLAISSFRRWLLSIPESQREAYSWKTHVPIVFSESQCMTCSVCSDLLRKARLWWERLDNHSAPGESNAKQYRYFCSHRSSSMLIIMQFISTFAMVVHGCSNARSWQARNFSQIHFPSVSSTSRPRIAKT